MKKLYSLLALVAFSASVNAQVVISQIYGGGGNTTGASRCAPTIILNQRVTTKYNADSAKCLRQKGNFGIMTGSPEA